MAFEAWSDQRTPILLPSKAITAEMSSVETEVSAPVIRNGLLQVVCAAFVVFETYTAEPRVKVTQSAPVLSLSMVADSVPPPENVLVVKAGSAVYFLVDVE